MPHEDGILFAADEIRHVEFTRADGASNDLGDDDGTSAETVDGQNPDEGAGAGAHPAQRTTDAADQHEATEAVAVSIPAEDRGRSADCLTERTCAA